MKDELSELEATFQEARNQMDAVHECFEKVNAIGSASPRDLPQEMLSGLASLRKPLAELEQRRTTLLQSVQGALSESQARVEASERLLGALDGAKESLLRRERESDLDRRSPVPLDPEALADQIADLEARRGQLEAHEGRVLQDARGELDTSPLAGPERNRLENAWREVRALYQTSLDAVAERVTHLQSEQALLIGLTNHIDETSALLQRAEVAVSALESHVTRAAQTPSTESGLAGLQAELKSSKESLDVAGKEVAQVDTLLGGVLGGDRVTGASSTHRLEKTVEGLHSLYSGLVGRTSQAERQLNALELQAGQFAVALEDARRAVEELEAKMGAQQPVSCEHPVLKAQHEEQKLLEQLVADRSHTIDQVATACRDLMLQADDSASATAVAPIELPPSDALQEQLQELGVRWSAVKTRVSERLLLIQQLRSPAQTFRAKLDQLLHWLQVTEARAEQIRLTAITDFTRLGPFTEECSVRCVAHNSLCEVLVCFTTYLFTIVVHTRCEILLVEYKPQHLIFSLPIEPSRRMCLSRERN